MELSALRAGCSPSTSAGSTIRSRPDARLRATWPTAADDRSVDVIPELAITVVLTCLIAPVFVLVAHGLAALLT